MNFSKNVLFLALPLLSLLYSSSIYSMEQIDIFEAIRTSNLARVKELIKAQPEDKRNAFLNQEKSGWDLLDLAIARGNNDIVKELFDSGANLKTQTSDAETRLYLATFYNNIPAITWLITCGANVNKPDKFGRTPLHAAATGEDSTGAINTLVKAGALVNQPDNLGNTPLHTAVKSGHINAVKALIAAGANLEARNNAGYTPLGETPLFDTDITNLLKNARSVEIGKTLAESTHERLGKESPVYLLPQELLRDISNLAIEKEHQEAKQPKK